MRLQAVPGRNPRAVTTGRHIRQARKAKGLSQSQLARLLPDAHDSYVSRWETGQHMPSWDHLEAVAEALDVTVAWLLSDD